MDEEKNIAKNRKINPATLLSLISLAGLIVLYFLFFTSDTKTTEQDSSYNVFSDTAKTNLRIAYINTDSILDNYTLALQKRDELAQKSRRMETEIYNQQKQYQQDASYFQEQVNKNALSEKSAQEIYEQLMQEQQRIIDLQQKYSEEIAQDEYNVNIMLVDSVSNFLDRFNRKHQFDYIIGYSKGGNIFYANHKLDITKYVIYGLNLEFDTKYGRK